MLAFERTFSISYRIVSCVSVGYSRAEDTVMQLQWSSWDFARHAKRSLQQAAARRRHVDPTPLDDR